MADSGMMVVLNRHQNTRKPARWVIKSVAVITPPAELILWHGKPPCVHQLSSQGQDTQGGGAWTLAQASSGVSLCVVAPSF